MRYVRWFSIYLACLLTILINNKAYRIVYYICKAKIKWIKALKQAIINIKNKKAYFEYEMLEKFTAGMVLTGTEIKSIRAGLASIKEGFCEFNEQGELFVINMYIKEFVNASFYNHQPRNSRKLLLNKRELKKLEKKVKDVGLTIVPLRLYLNEKGWAKLDIALAKGKKQHDKRHTLKDRENQRDLARVKKDFKKY